MQKLFSFRCSERVNWKECDRQGRGLFQWAILSEEAEEVKEPKTLQPAHRPRFSPHNPPRTKTHKRLDSIHYLFLVSTGQEGRRKQENGEAVRTH